MSAALRTWRMTPKEFLIWNVGVVHGKAAILELPAIGVSRRLHDPHAGVLVAARAA